MKQLFFILFIPLLFGCKKEESPQPINLAPIPVNPHGIIISKVKLVFRFNSNILYKHSTKKVLKGYLITPTDSIVLQSFTNLDSLVMNIMLPDYKVQSIKMIGNIEMSDFFTVKQSVYIDGGYIGGRSESCVSMNHNIQQIF